MDISIIIPTYRSQRTLGECLDSILCQQIQCSYEIIVVDSSPGDEVIALLRQYPRVILLKEIKMTRPGPARNIGANQAKGEILLFIDSDIMLPPGALNQIFKYFKNGHDVFSCAIDLSRPASKFLFSKLEMYFEFSEFKRKMPEGQRWCLPSYTMAVNRDIFNRFKNSEKERCAEDTDLTVRIKREGYPLYFYPDLCVYHDSRPSFKNLVSKIYRYAVYDAVLRIDHKVSGSSFVRNRYLRYFIVPGFALVKLTKITWRNVRYNTFFDIFLFIIAIPVIFYLILVWMAGFYSGLIFENRIKQ